MFQVRSPVSASLDQLASAPPVTDVEFCSLGELERLGLALCNGMIRESV